MAHHRKVAGLDVRRVAILGTGRAASAIAQRMADNPQYGYVVTGFIEENGDNGNDPDSRTTQPRLGHLQHLKALLRNNEIDHLIVATPHVTHETSWKSSTPARRNDRRVQDRAGPLRVAPARHGGREPRGYPPVVVQRDAAAGVEFVLKRLFDIGASSLLLLITSPVFAVIATLIKLESRGSVLYLQERMGLDGRVFRMIKFRSMRVDAEKGTGPMEP